MKQLFVIFASLICACGRGASPATQSASPATQASFPATQQVDLTSISSVKIWFYPWFLDIKPDGSAFIQYGSTFGDSATLPKGTCDFEVIVAEIIRQRFGGTGHADVSAGLVMKGVKSTTLSSLKDDAYFRKLIE